jgi:hypothetical protein
VLLGLHAGQLATLLLGVACALLANQSLPAPEGTGLAFLVLAGSAVVALWPRSGRPLVSWLPVAAGWLGRRSSVGTVAFEPLVGQAPRRRTVASEPLVGQAPQPRRARPGRGTGEVLVGQAPRPSRARSGRHTGPAGIVLAETDGGPGGEALGLVRDHRYGTWAAVLPVQGRSFVLLDLDAQIGQLEAWRAVLGALARPGTPLRRLQWLHCSAPAVGAGRVDGPGVRARPSDGPVDEIAGWEAARQSYRELVADEGPVTQSHHAWLVVAVGGAPRPGLLGQRGLDELRREVRLLTGQLRNADLQAGAPLDLDGLRALVGAAYRPDRSVVRGRQRTRPWPMASDETWSAFRTDGAWHATFWIAEWPRVEVNPDFLTPLLLRDGRRTVSVVMAPVAPDRAAREVRAARAADTADEELRSRAGFLPSARRRREADGVIRREAELADGHADYRFSGYVTVTAADRDGLEAACAETAQAAERAHLELRRLYGRQVEAFTWTLPLARGLS